LLPHLPTSIFSIRGNPRDDRVDRRRQGASAAAGRRDEAATSKGNWVSKDTATKKKNKYIIKVFDFETKIGLQILKPNFLLTEIDSIAKYAIAVSVINRLIGCLCTPLILLYRYKEPFLSKHVFSKINHTFVQLGKIC
jgi:hypothetical protein